MVKLYCSFVDGPFFIKHVFEKEEEEDGERKLIKKEPYLKISEFDEVNILSHADRSDEASYFYIFTEESAKKFKFGFRLDSTRTLYLARNEGEDNLEGELSLVVGNSHSYSTLPWGS